MQNVKCGMQNGGGRKNQPQPKCNVDRQLEELSAAVKLTPIDADKSPVGGAERTENSAYARGPRALAVVRYQPMSLS